MRARVPRERHLEWEEAHRTGDREFTPGAFPARGHPIRETFPWEESAMSLTTCFRRRKPSRHAATWRTRLGLEALEPRDLLDGSLANVLVNDPALDTTPQDLQNQTSIVLGSGNKVVVAYNDSGSFSMANPCTLGYSVSNNGGATFTDKGTLPATAPYYTLGDPVLARSSKTGTIFLSTITALSAAFPDYLADRINIFRSTDNGDTFGDPINATPGFVDGVDHFGRDSIAVDNFPGPGYGNVYLAWGNTTWTSPLRNGKGSDRGIYFARSLDDGVTWGPNGGVPIDVKPGNEQAVGDCVTVGPDHAVYVFWWNQTNGEQILMRRSNDRGQTFGDPVVVSDLRTNDVIAGNLGLTDGNGQPFATYIIPQAAVNPNTGDIYVIYPDKPETKGDKADIFFTQSTDGGATWSTPLRVNDDATTNDQWQPALAVTPDGSRVGIFWYDRRLDPANDLIDRYGAIGSVTGHTVTFGANFRITEVSFPAARGVDPVFPGWYAATGEYDQALADKDYFYTTWGDNRLADAFHANQPDVRLAKVPVDWQEPDLQIARSTAGTDYAAPAAGAAMLSQETSWDLSALDSLYMDLARSSEANKTTKRAAFEPPIDLMFHDPLALL
jgi:hypothetical protein